MSRPAVPRAAQLSGQKYAARPYHLRPLCDALRAPRPCQSANASRKLACSADAYYAPPRNPAAALAVAVRSRLAQASFLWFTIASSRSEPSQQQLGSATLPTRSVHDTLAWRGTDAQLPRLRPDPVPATPAITSGGANTNFKGGDGGSGGGGNSGGGDAAAPEPDGPWWPLLVGALVTVLCLGLVGLAQQPQPLQQRSHVLQSECTGESGASVLTQPVPQSKRALPRSESMTEAEAFAAMVRH